MAEHDETHAAAPAEAGHEHGEIHLPPNSFVPLFVALSMALTFAGFLAGYYLWAVGLVCLIVSLLFWLRAARNEYLELPE